MRMLPFVLAQVVIKAAGGSSYSPVPLLPRLSRKHSYQAWHIAARWAQKIMITPPHMHVSVRCPMHAS